MDQAAEKIMSDGLAIARDAECSETADGVARESEGRSRLSFLSPVLVKDLDLTTWKPLESS